MATNYKYPIGTILYSEVTDTYMTVVNHITDHYTLHLFVEGKFFIGPMSWAQVELEIASFPIIKSKLVSIYLAPFVRLS